MTHAVRESTDAARRSASVSVGVAGTFTVSIGASSADLRRSVTVTVSGEELRAPLAADSTLAEWSADPSGARLLTRVFGDAAGTSTVAEQPMAAQIPLSVLAGLAGVPRSTVDALAEEVAGQEGPDGDAVSPGPH